MFFSHWSSPKIAHTILSWSFANAAPLAISIETRKVVGQEYSAVAGFFRQYPIYYVAADERDVIGVRTNFRGENVCLYRLKTPPENARRLLLDYVKSMNALVERPEWYNAFTANCTTTIRQHVRHSSPGVFPARLAAAHERLSRRVALRARRARHEPAFCRAARDLDHRRTRQGRWRQLGLLRPRFARACQILSLRLDPRRLLRRAVMAS